MMRENHEEGDNAVLEDNKWPWWMMFLWSKNTNDKRLNDKDDYGIATVRTQVAWGQELLTHNRQCAPAAMVISSILLRRLEQWWGPIGMSIMSCWSQFKEHKDLYHYSSHIHQPTWCWKWSCLVSMDNPAGNEELCELVRELLSAGAYEPWIQVFFTLALIFSCLQDLIAAAQYWHDPLNHTNYAHGKAMIVLGVTTMLMFYP